MVVVCRKKFLDSQYLILNLVGDKDSAAQQHYTTVCDTLVWSSSVFICVKYMKFAVIVRERSAHYYIQIQRKICPKVLLHNAILFVGV